jgi:citrate lyase subunit beta/citryl-CoA lyase
VCAWLEQHPRSDVPVFVRINDEATPWHADDLHALLALQAASALARFGVMLPKCESPAQISRCLAGFVTAPNLIAIIESARGVQQVDAIANAPGVQCLAFGTLDYAVDLDIPNDAAGLAYAAARIAIASRVAGLPAPVAGVTPELNADRVATDMHWARGFGYCAKLCIHPAQVAPVHAALMPSAAQRSWAQRVLAATDGQTAAVQVDGRMVDRPVILQAQRILATSLSLSSRSSPSSLA